jgi:hypothetical protein
MNSGCGGLPRQLKPTQKMQHMEKMIVPKGGRIADWEAADGNECELKCIKIQKGGLNGKV